MKKFEPQIFAWLLAILLPIFAVYPALTASIEEHAYDAAIFHVYRGVVFSAARAEGVLYPRWVQPINAGLGGPLFNFYAPLPYYLMDALANFGINQPIAWRLLTAAFLIAASTGMFGLALALFKRAEVALLAAVMFTYNSFLLRDLFERGSPQGWAVALYPWLLWLLLRLSTSPSGLRLLLASICWAMIILLHNAAALLLLLVIGNWLMFIAIRFGAKRACVSSTALGIGILLSAFFLIPYFAESQFVQIENLNRPEYTQPAANPLQVQELLSLPSVFDIGIDNNAIGESGGLLPALSLPIGIVAAFSLWRKKRIAEFVLVSALIAFEVGMLWMQTDAATWVWSNVPALTIFQFRWKLLGTLGIAAGILMGFAFESVRSRSQNALVTFLIAILIAFHFPSLYPQLLFRYNQFPAKPTVSDAQALALQVGAPGLSSYNEFLPRWRTQPFTRDEAQRVASTPIANLPNGARITRDERGAGWMRATLETTTGFDAAMHVLYFPGWVGDMDGLAATLKPMEGSGYILMTVPPGVHTITLRYDGTFAQHVGDWISIAAVIALLLFVILSERSDRRISHETLKIKESSEMLRFAQHDNVTYLTPRWWLPVGIILLAAFKAYWIDPQTTLFRANSSCDSIQGVSAQTNIRFDENIWLCGYTLSRTEFHSRDLLRLTLYWQINRAAEQSAFSFVHLLGTAFNPQTGNPLWGQQDKLTPGEHSITEWLPGKLYRDVYEFRIAPDAPPGNYQLEIGWQGANAQRLKPIIISSAANLAASHLDSLLLSGIQIR